MIKMPTVCSVPGSQRQTGRFKFPSDPNLEKQWRIAIKREGPRKTLWKPTSGARVCERHFKSEDFRTPMNSLVALGAKPRRDLKVGVIPSVFAHSRDVPEAAVGRAARRSRRDKESMDVDETSDNVYI